MQRYSLFGLAVDSSITLPDLPATTATTPPDVVIGYGTVPVPRHAEPIGLYVTGDGAVLNIPEAGRFFIADGASIVVEPAPTASERNVRLYLLGSAFGAILHQRRLLPLHANVIDIGGAAVAFAGHSGAGKSTLASWFHDRGYRILGDDVCVVRDDSAGTAMVAPGLPRIRLWRDALDASGRRAADFVASFDDMDKFDVPTTGAPADGPLPLAAIYTLQPTAPGQPALIVRLAGIEAVNALVANTYRGGYVPLMGRVEQHLAQCLSLARRVPVFALHRRWGHEVFADEAARVLAHIGDVLAARTQMSQADH